MTTAAGSLLTVCFDSGKGSGAALLFAVLGILGVAVCLIFRHDKSIWSLEGKETL